MPNFLREGERKAQGDRNERKQSLKSHKTLQANQARKRDIPKPKLEPKRQTNLSLGEKRGRNKYIAPKERIYMHPSLSFSFSFPHWGKIKNYLWAGGVISFTNEEKGKLHLHEDTPFLHNKSRCETSNHLQLQFQIGPPNHPHVPPTLLSNGVKYVLIDTSPFDGKAIKRQISIKTPHNDKYANHEIHGSDPLIK